jgi:hypothetical protein
MCKALWSAAFHRDESRYPGSKAVQDGTAPVLAQELCRRDTFPKGRAGGWPRPRPILSCPRSVMVSPFDLRVCAKEISVLLRHGLPHIHGFSPTSNSE